MANAADYLRVSTTQIVTNYKLRTRAVKSETASLTNTATDQILTAVVNDVPVGVTVVPTQVTLQPNQTTTLTITYDTAYLETLKAGNVINTLTFTVTAQAIEIPVAPPAPVQPPPPPPPTAPAPTAVPQSTPEPQPTPTTATPTGVSYDVTFVNPPFASSIKKGVEFTIDARTYCCGNTGMAIDIGQLVIDVVPSSPLNIVGGLTSVGGNASRKFTLNAPAVYAVRAYVPGTNYFRQISNIVIQGETPAPTPTTPTPTPTTPTPTPTLVKCDKINQIISIGSPQPDGTTNVCRYIQDTFVGGCRESCVDEPTITTSQPTPTPTPTITNVTTIPVGGCMDPNANNYNSNATFDDGSCQYGGTPGQFTTTGTIVASPTMDTGQGIGPGETTFAE